eukprot:scaffold147_cov113-Cylindrotheca_fusiformis.AAC.2
MDNSLELAEEDIITQDRRSTKKDTGGASNASHQDSAFRTDNPLWYYFFAIILAMQRKLHGGVSS